MTDIKRVVITGATSTLGTALIEECIEQGIEVLALANRGSKNLYRIPQNSLVTTVECRADEYDSDDLHERIRNLGDYDALFNLTWTSTGGDAARNNLSSQVENIRYSLNAVELAYRLNCKVFIGAGSQAEYGRTDEILTEETECHPETAYGIAKLCAGQMTRLCCNQKGIKHIWPRILSAYGPNCQPHTIINYTITELLNGRSPELTACEQIWDFVYTGDVVKALLLLSSKGEDNEIYLIGQGKSRPLREYIETVYETVKEFVHEAGNGLTGKTGEIPPIKFGARPYGENTVMHLACDISKITRTTGFIPRAEFKDGIYQTVRYIYSNLGRTYDNFSV